MTTIVTRAGKGSALTWVEADANITNLNTYKIETSAIGSSVQAYSSNLSSWSSLSPSSKQDTLVSATNIKTINSTSLLGSGDVSVQPVLVSGTNIKTINGSSILGAGDLTVSGGSGAGETFNPFLLMGA
jgi:hypothetical protein